MRKLLFLIILLCSSFSSFAEDVEITLSGPLVRENVVDVDITENAPIRQNNPCASLNPGYNNCSVSGDMITVNYPLLVTTEIKSGFSATMAIEISLHDEQYFHSIRVLENSYDLPPYVDFYSSETKSYQIEIKIKYEGPDSFQNPKGAIDFTLNASAI